MIITKIKLNNWYSFKDCTLDLSYPRKIVDSNIPFEYLDAFENIRFKRVVILSGANATGKTSFAKILLAIRSFISSGELNRYFSEGMNKNEDSLSFTVEFIDQNPIPENIDCSNLDPSSLPDRQLRKHKNLTKLIIGRSLPDRQLRNKLLFLKWVP